MNNETGRKLVLEVLEEYPDTPTKTIARMLYKAHPEVWADLEATRTQVRYYRGNCGKYNRDKIKDRRFLRKPGCQSDGQVSFQVPAGDCAGEFEPYEIKKGRHALVLSDIHFPYHDKVALEVALQYGYDQEVDTIILNGDTQDCYSVSRWCKDPRKRGFADEIEMVKEFLELLRETWPKANIVWKDGNHEERYEAYLKQKAPEILGLADIEYAKLLGLRELGIKYVSSKRPVKFGDLPILHGHEYGKGISNPVNPARGLFMKTKLSAMCGHYHQSSSHSENRLDGQSPTTFSLGCLCDLHPEYLPLNKWNHGFALVKLEGGKKRDWLVSNKKIGRKGEVW